MIRRIMRGTNQQRGDTIVEVVIALTVLSLILGSSSVLAGRNTRTLQDSQEKSVALRLAQEQLEFLKTKVKNDPTVLSSLVGAICMKNSSTTTTDCTDTNGGAEYKKTLTVDGVSGSNDQYFNTKATVTWVGLNSRSDEEQDKSKVQLSYRVYTKLAAVRAPGLGSHCPPNQYDPTGTGSCVLAPKVTLNASTTSITSGSSATLTWSSEHVNACTASGAWSGSLNTSGSRVVWPTSTSNYTITCTDGTGTAISAVTINVAPPRPPRVALHRCYQFYDFSGNLAIKTNHIFTTNSGECNGGNAGGHYEGVTAYVPLSSNGGAIPMYGGRNPVIQDDFYTTDYQEYYNAHYNGWSQNSGVRFYVYPYTSSGCSVGGTVPLYRWYSGVTGDHVYPVSPYENPNNYAPVDGGGTFIYEGIAGCVFSEP